MNLYKNAHSFIPLKHVSVKIRIKNDAMCKGSLSGYYLDFQLCFLFGSYWQISLILVKIWKLFHFFLADPFNFLNLAIFNELFCFIHIVVEKILNDRFLVAIYHQLGRFKRKLVSSKHIALVGIFKLFDLLSELFLVRVCLIIGIERVVILNPDQEGLCELLFRRWGWKHKTIDFYSAQYLRQTLELP